MPAPVLSSSQKKALEACIAKGDLDGAQNILAGAKKAADEAAAKPAVQAEPRTLNEVLLDFAKSVHSLLGNSPALVPIINELEQLVTEPKAEEKPAPAATT